MGLSIKHDKTSTILSGVGRQPLRERHVCPNVNDDIPQQRCKEAHRQLRRPHVRTLDRGNTHSTRCVAGPAGQSPAVEHRPAAKEGQQGQSKVLRVHRKVKVESSSSRPSTAAATDATSTALSGSTVEDTIGAPQALGDERWRTSAGTMHFAVSGDVRDNLERWRNHYSQSAIGSLSYVKSPLDVVAVTSPTNTSFASNTDAGRRKPSTCLAFNGPGLSSQSRLLRRCWICGSERSHGTQEGVAKVEDGGVLGAQIQPIRRPPTARIGVSLRSASAEGCWFCHEGVEAAGEKPAGVGVDCRDVMLAPSATVGGRVRSSGGRAPFDGRADGPNVGDSHSLCAERLPEVNAGVQAERGVAERIEAHVGTKAVDRSGVNDIGEKRDRRGVQATGSAAERLSGGSTRGRGRGAGDRQRSVEKCRGNGGGVDGRVQSERPLDDGLATLRSGTHRRFQDRKRCKQKGVIITSATRKDYILELTSYGDCPNLGGRESGGGYERKKCNSGKSDGEIGRKSVPQNDPRGEFIPTREAREAACFDGEGDGGRSPADVQAGAFFGDPLCWEEEGVWWFRPPVNDATYDSHTAAVLRSRLNTRRNAEAKLIEDLI